MTHFKQVYGHFWLILLENPQLGSFLGSIVVSIPSCHAGDRGSIPRRGEEGHLLGIQD